MGTADVQLWPHRRIIGVAWGSNSFYVYVQAIALYRHGVTTPPRQGTLTITDEGKKFGGTIIGQKNFDIPGTDAYTIFRGVMKFTSTPLTSTPAKAHYELELEGAQKVNDDSAEVIHLFCGTSSSFGQVCYKFQEVPGVPGQFQVIATQTMTTSTPAGTSTLTQEYIAADISPDNYGKCFPIPSGSQDELWYIDGDGDYHNTHEPCPAPPDPAPSSHIEGFDNILQQIWPTKGYTVKPVIDWEGVSETGRQLESAIDIIIPTDPLNDDASLFQEEVPREFLGVSHHENKFDDLPDDHYSFVLQKLTFTELPQPKPKTPYTVVGMWPLEPSFVRYAIHPATLKPYQAWQEAPIEIRGEPLRLLAGSPPPSDQEFTEF